MNGCLFGFQIKQNGKENGELTKEESLFVDQDKRQNIFFFVLTLLDHGWLAS